MAQAPPADTLPTDLLPLIPLRIEVVDLLHDAQLRPNWRDPWRIDWLYRWRNDRADAWRTDWRQINRAGTESFDLPIDAGAPTRSKSLASKKENSQKQG